MTTKQLDYIKVVKSSGAGRTYWAYEMHKRSASAFSMIIMTLIGFRLPQERLRRNRTSFERGSSRCGLCLF